MQEVVDIKNMALQDKIEQARKELARIPDEKHGGLMEYWSNAQAQRANGYVKMRPQAESTINIDAAVLVFEVWSQSVLAPIPADEETKYIYVEATRTSDSPPAWELVDVHELTAGEFAGNKLLCHSCMSFVPTPSVEACMLYWLPVANPQENATPVDVLPLQKCNWVKIVE